MFVDVTQRSKNGSNGGEGGNKLERNKSKRADALNGSHERLLSRTQEAVRGVLRHKNVGDWCCAMHDRGSLYSIDSAKTSDDKEHSAVVR